MRARLGHLLSALLATGAFAQSDPVAAAFSTASTDLTSKLVALVPYALSVLVLVGAIGWGIRALRRVLRTA